MNIYWFLQRDNIIQQSKHVSNPKNKKATPAHYSEESIVINNEASTDICWRLRLTSTRGTAFLRTMYDDIWKQYGSHKHSEYYTYLFEIGSVHKTR